jgi:hypothetical protein
MKYRFQHFHKFTNEQLMRLIEDASGRGQIKPHAKWGWTPLIQNTKAVTVCTIEDADRNVRGKGFVFLKNGHTPKEIRRRITQGRAQVAWFGGRKAFNKMKHALKCSMAEVLSKKGEFDASIC